MSKVAIFTDASRITNPDGTGTGSSAYGWIALDMLNMMSSFAVPFVERMTEYTNSTVHAEVLAIHHAAHAYGDAQEVHIFTDSLYCVEQVRKARQVGDNRTRPLRVFPDKIAEIAAMENIKLHHVRAHKFFFFNELVDQMTRFVARGDMTIEEAEDWGRKTCRIGTIEISIGKNADHGKLIRREHDRNHQVIANALS